MTTTTEAPFTRGATNSSASTAKRFTIADLADIPQPWDDTRYEIIDGELFVSSQPSAQHQYSCNEVAGCLRNWNAVSGLGWVLPAPGVIFADDDNAAPDVVWLSRDRLRSVIGREGHLHGPPELIVEVLSPGAVNERRDRDAKLKLYGRRGVDEYWIVNWQLRHMDVYRRAPAGGNRLEHVTTLEEDAALESPLLPGFAVTVGDLFLPQDL